MSYSEPLSKNPKNLNQKDVLFYLMIHFRSLKFFFLDVGGGLSVYSCCCLTDGLSFFLWMWKNVVELLVERWYVGGSLSRTAQQCVEEKHVFCQQVYSYFTVLKYFTQQLLLFKQRYTSNKVSLNL